MTLKPNPFLGSLAAMRKLVCGPLPGLFGCFSAVLRVWGFRASLCPFSGFLKASLGPPWASLAKRSKKASNFVREKRPKSNDFGSNPVFGTIPFLRLSAGLGVGFFEMLRKERKESQCSPSASERRADKGNQPPQTTSEAVGTSPSVPQPPRRSNSDMANACATRLGWAHCLRGAPSALNGLTKVMSMANWAPWKRGKPSATTSRRQSSNWPAGKRARLVDTLPPASADARITPLQRRPSTSEHP